jgi:hypothetical protein
MEGWRLSSTGGWIEQAAALTGPASLQWTAMKLQHTAVIFAHLKYN